MVFQFITRWTVMFLLLTSLPREAKAGGIIGLPFHPGQAWTVCRGYNGPKEHSLAPVLDLTIGPNSVGTNGCVGDASASAGKDVIAPGAGTVHWFSSIAGANDGICLAFDSGGAVGVLHFNPSSRWTDGQPIQKGQLLGTLAGPNDFNGVYSHIHIQAHKGDCRGILQEFTEGNGFRFEGAPGLPCDYYDPNTGACTGGSNQHSGLTLENPTNTRWHPDGTLIRVKGTATVYFLQDGKKRGFTSLQALEANGWKLHEDVIVVPPEELACYPDGTVITGYESSIHWNPDVKEGDVVWWNVKGPVYIASGGKLRWLNISGEQLPLFGYRWEKVHLIYGSWQVGVNISASDFTDGSKCNLIPPPCTYTLTPSAKNFSGEGGALTVSVSAPSSCSWQVVSPETWIHANPMSGNGNGTTTISVDKNPSTTTSRGNNVTIGGVVFRVDQDNSTATTPSNCVTSLTPTAYNFSANGEARMVSVSAPTNCSWQVTSPETWIHASPLSGNGNGTVTLSVDQNPSTTTSRGNNVTIGGVIFRVDQDNSTSTGGSNCVSSLTPSAKNFSGNGGSLSVSVTAPSSCSWQVSLPESWIHASPSSATGPGTVTISVDQNPSTTTSRGNNVTIGGVVFRVDQDNRIGG